MGKAEEPAGKESEVPIAGSGFFRVRDQGTKKYLEDPEQAPDLRMTCEKGADMVNRFRCHEPGNAYRLKSRGCDGATALAHSITCGNLPLALWRKKT
jgi:hypothetical protein